MISYRKRSMNQVIVLESKHIFYPWKLQDVVAIQLVAASESDVEVLVGMHARYVAPSVRDCDVFFQGFRLSSTF